MLAGGGALTQAEGSGVTGVAGVNLVLAGGLSQDATSYIGSAGGNVTIDATSGNINFAGIIEASPLTGVLDNGANENFAGSTTLIADAGSIEGNAGTVWTGVLAARAANDIDLADARNQITTIAAVNNPDGGAVAGLQAGGTLSLNDTVALTVQDSTVSAMDGMRLTLSSDVTESSGSTIASADGSIEIESPTTMRFAGELAAPLILLGNKVSPQQIIWDGGSIRTGSAIPVPPGGGSPSIPDPIGLGSPFYGKGLFATAGNFVQTGTTVVGGLPGDPRQTVQLTLRGTGGTIAFNPQTGGMSGLYGPTTQLLLNLNTRGRATGNITVAGLNIYYYGSTPGAGGGSTLTGSVDGRTGSAAAASGFVHSLPGVNYELNDCPVQSLSCVLLSPIIVPLGSPVQDVEVAVAHRRQDDDDLILPNVAEQDY